MKGSKAGLVSFGIPPWIRRNRRHGHATVVLVVLVVLVVVLVDITIDGTIDGTIGSECS